ncbi:MAG: adenylate/guanylate cyclase domain-containing protein [Pseudomonadota bacterium]
MVEDKALPQIKRGIGRRRQDIEINEALQQYRQLMDIGQLITSEMDLNALFGVIIEQTNRILHIERSTLFLFDAAAGELWSLVATEMKSNEIRIPTDAGLVGWAFTHRTVAVVDDVYADERFNPDVDRATGFRTRNMLCLPIRNRQGEQIGVFQALNKIDGAFTVRDITVVSALSHYMAIALENAALYRDVKLYSQRLEETLVRFETLNRMKAELTKFVPHSVQKMLESRPEGIPLEKEARDVSVLFIDIAGFSAITERYDHRLVNDMVERHFSAFLDSIQANGGEVNETAGDGLMVIFDSNSVADHAGAALRSGLAIIAENRRINAEGRYPWGNVNLHLGVNSGTALVGCTRIVSPAGDRYTYTASGLVTVLAARIAALSSGKELFCGEETYRLVKDRCTATALGKSTVKNVAEPVSVYAVTALEKDA